MGVHLTYMQVLHIWACILLIGVHLTGVHLGYGAYKLLVFLIQNSCGVHSELERSQISGRLVTALQHWVLVSSRLVPMSDL